MVNLEEGGCNSLMMIIITKKRMLMIHNATQEELSVNRDSSSATRRDRKVTIRLKIDPSLSKLKAFQIVFSLYQAFRHMPIMTSKKPLINGMSAFFFVGLVHD